MSAAQLAWSWSWRARDTRLSAAAISVDSDGLDFFGFEKVHGDSERELYVGPIPSGLYDGSYNQ